MAETEAVKSAETEGKGEREEQRLLEGVAVLDFDMLCSTVALQAQGKWTKFDHHGNGDDEDGGEFGGVFRMWEGELLDCFEDRRIAIQTTCCPCYRFGKNMRRAGFGSCFIQGTVYFMLSFSAFLSCIAFFVTKRHCFLYMAVAFTLSVGTYMGFFRTQIKKKFNIRVYSFDVLPCLFIFLMLYPAFCKSFYCLTRVSSVPETWPCMGGDSYLDDCAYHLICPCCTLCQEARTLEMNNVQDGTWHGRGDTICIGSHSESSKAFFELHPPSPVSTKPPESCSMQKSIDSNDGS